MGFGSGGDSDVAPPVTAVTGAETTRLIPLIALLTALLTRPAAFFLAAFLAVFFAGALRAFTALPRRAVFLTARFFAAFFAGRLAAFLDFFAAFFLTTRLAI
jgi:hypothetical protein